MHQAARDYVAGVTAELGLDPGLERYPVGVDIGGRDVNGTTRPLFPHTTWTVLDAQQGGPEVDVVADGAVWQPPQLVDVVLCTEVFEHTPDWRRIVANAFRMLRVGGVMITTMAGPGRAPHGVNIDDPLHPGWYQNVTADELADAFRQAGFGAWSVERLGDDTRGWAVA